MLLPIMVVAASAVAAIARPRTLVQRTGYHPTARTVTVQEGDGIGPGLLKRESDGNGDCEGTRSV
jgi:hypothetical protein